MINSIIVTNYLNEEIEMELRRPEKSGFLVERVEGIDPPKADINTTELATRDGALYNSARTVFRNISLVLKYYSLDPSVSIEDLRQKSYRYFPIKKKVTIKFLSDNRECYTEGYVESNEIDIFSKNVGCVISIKCPDPYFYDLVKTTTLLGSIVSEFEFPFSNESLTENLIELSSILVGGFINVQYDGEAETGAVFKVHMIGPAENITIYNYITLESMVFHTDFLSTWDPAGLVAGDDLIISTLRGEKYVRLLRDGVYYNVLNGFDLDSTWLQLKKGENIIGFSATSGASNLQISIEHHTMYEGV